MSRARIKYGVPEIPRAGNAAGILNAIVNICPTGHAANLARRRGARPRAGCPGLVHAASASVAVSRRRGARLSRWEETGCFPGRRYAEDG